MMHYKGYTGRITAVDENQGLLHGIIEGINDVVTFEGAALPELVQAFHDSVDDYLAFCQERAEEPDKPFSGRFLVRIPPALHQQAAQAAAKAGGSLNSWVATAIETYLGKTPAGERKGEGYAAQDDWRADSANSTPDVHKSLLGARRNKTPFTIDAATAKIWRLGNKR